MFVHTQPPTKIISFKSRVYEPIFYVEHFRHFVDVALLSSIHPLERPLWSIRATQKKLGDEDEDEIFRESEEEVFDVL